MPLTLRVMMRKWTGANAARRNPQKSGEFTRLSRPRRRAFAALARPGCGEGPRRIIGAHRSDPTPKLTDFRQEFLAFALARDVLRFGEFVTKAGRLTPYFFNAGLFNDGESLRRLGRYYAEAALASGLKFDQLFGPAYKGITLAAAMSIALAEMGHNLPYCFN